MPVAVWEISQKDEANLDRYEGVPFYYVKEHWPVHMDDGSEIDGMIYIMKAIRPSPPTEDYYAAIVRTYRALGLRSQIGTVLQPALVRSLRRETTF